MVVDDVVCTNDPLSTSYSVGAYESDPRIDLDGLLWLVDLFGCFLLASPRAHTFIRVDRLCATTAILSQPMHHQHHCTHARVTKQLFAELAQGSCDYSRRRETPIGGELQLVGIALITINQRDSHILVAQATITNKCHSLYVALVSSVVVVIQIYSCTKLTWMDGWIFLRRRYTYFSLSRHLRQTIISE